MVGEEGKAQDELLDISCSKEQGYQTGSADFADLSLLLSTRKLLLSCQLWAGYYYRDLWAVQAAWQVWLGNTYVASKGARLAERIAAFSGSRLADP